MVTNQRYFYLLILLVPSKTHCLLDRSSGTVIHSFKIPNTVNKPTLKIGDHVLADMMTYPHTKPNFGDCIVFQKKDSINPCVFSTVGLPSDTLHVQNNFLTINGKKSATTLVRGTLID